ICLCRVTSGTGGVSALAARAVLLDLDGTLWDSYPWYAQVLEQTGKLSRAAARRRLRGRESIVTLMRECGLGLGTFRAACADLRLYAGALESLRRLDRRDASLGVVTSLPQRLALPMLEALELEECFVVMRFAAGRAKARSIVEALRHMRVNA